MPCMAGGAVREPSVLPARTTCTVGRGCWGIQTGADEGRAGTRPAESSTRRGSLLAARVGGVILDGRAPQFGLARLTMHGALSQSGLDDSALRASPYPSKTNRPVFKGG